MPSVSKSDFIVDFGYAGGALKGLVEWTGVGGVPCSEAGGAITDVCMSMERGVGRVLTVSKIRTVPTGH